MTILNVFIKPSLKNRPSIISATPRAKKLIAFYALTFPRLCFLPSPLINNATRIAATLLF
jgi:hypothetical protein